MMNDDNVPEFPPSDLIDAWRAGWDACCHGAPFAANPHLPNTYARRQWADGWLAANNRVDE